MKRIAMAKRDAGAFLNRFEHTTEKLRGVMVILDELPVAAMGIFGANVSNPYNSAVPKNFTLTRHSEQSVAISPLQPYMNIFVNAG